MIIESENIKKIFDDDIKDHKLTIIMDDGLSRHIRLANPKTMIRYYDLITWKRHLCICGDMGTYVFKRIDDMFDFFRGDKINSRYWTEKLVSDSMFGGYHEFDIDNFREIIKEEFEEWEFKDEVEKERVWADVEFSVLTMDPETEQTAMTAAIDYKSDYDHEFGDFWETTITQYTHNYIWILHAIVHGIKLYDESKKENDGN